MRLDRAKLRAYLDGELLASEQSGVEQQLNESVQARRVLEELRLAKTQVNETLDRLGPTPDTNSPARLAFKRLQAQLNPDSRETSLSERPAPSEWTVWESPTFLTELKSLLKEHFYRQPRQAEKEQLVSKKLLLAGLTGLIIVILAGAVALWPSYYNNEGVDPAGEVEEGPGVMVNPQTTEPTVETTSVLVALQGIGQGTAITPGSVGRRNWPSNNLPADFATAEAEVMGRIAQTNIVQGQVIVRPMIQGTAGATVELPADTMPLSTIFDDQIELAGYRLAKLDPYRLDLFWRALQPIENNYTVFIHLMRGDEIVAGWDTVPVQGLAPTNTWQPGEIIVDAHPLVGFDDDFTPGNYELVVGLYNSETGQRLTVQSQDVPVLHESSVLLTQIATGQGELTFGRGIQVAANGDTAANIGHLQQLGLEWVKLQMPWKEVEPLQGEYEWAFWDRVIDAYAANDFKVMLNVVKAPDWARPLDDDKGIDGPPADPATYAEFVANVAGRYAGKVRAIEVWNEQNLWYKAGGQGRMDAAVYVQLLQPAYRAIKAANENVLVISGALSPAGNVGKYAVDDIDYLNQMYATGLQGHFDALGATPWGFNCPALADWRTVTPEEAGADPDHGLFRNRHHSWCFLGSVEAYREVMVVNGDGDKPIAITGFGWALPDRTQSIYDFAGDNTSEEQARWIVEAYQWAEAQTWVGPMILFNLDFNTIVPGSGLDYYSILDTPAYDALAALNESEADAVVEVTPTAFELDNVRQLAPCENRGRRLLLIKLVDPTGQGLNDVPVKIQWGHEVNDLVIVRTETIDDEPGRIVFQMTEDSPYSVEVQTAASPPVTGLTTGFAEQEPCADGGPGNKPGYISYEVIFRQTAPLLSTPDDSEEK